MVHGGPPPPWGLRVHLRDSPRGWCSGLPCGFYPISISRLFPATPPPGSTGGTRGDACFAVPLRMLTEATAQHLVPIACVRQVEVARHKGFVCDEGCRSREREQGGNGWELGLAETVRDGGQGRNKRQKR